MRRLPSAVFSLALAACSATDLATTPSSTESTSISDTESSARAAVWRPLSGRCTTAVTRLAPPPIEVQRIEYTCRISHLGLSHAIVTQTVDVTTGVLSSTGTYVAANGDELGVSFSGTAALSFTDPTDATVTFQGIQEFSAGTGRFADADGRAELSGTAAINLITGAGTGEFSFDGMLSY